MWTITWVVAAAAVVGFTPAASAAPVTRTSRENKSLSGDADDDAPLGPNFAPGVNEIPTHLRVLQEHAETYEDSVHDASTPEVAHRLLQGSESSGGSANSFTVGSGDPCSASGRCFYSPNHPSNYHNHEDCTITPVQSGPLVCVAWETESSYDRIEIDGTRYSGRSMSSCPDGIEVQAGVSFSWQTDGTVTKSGFEICMAGPPTREQCAAINEIARADPACADPSSQRCPLECALSHLSSMVSCTENFPDPSFRQECQDVIDALVDQGPSEHSADPTSCYYANDGDCDEPRYCILGSDPDCARPDEPRAFASCPVEDVSCPPSGQYSDDPAWTQMFYIDADNNLEKYKVATLNAIASRSMGGNVVVSGAGDQRSVGEYLPLLASHTDVVGSEIFAQQDEAGVYSGLAIFVSHTSDGSRAWVLADLGPALNDVEAAWIYSIESEASRPPASGWTAESGDEPTPAIISAAAGGPLSCIGDYLNMVVLIDRCRSGTPHCDASDHYEIIGIIDADGHSVSGLFTGAKRLQLLPPSSAGRWLALDDNMQPLHAGDTATDPEPDTSSGDTLEQFVRAAMSTYPADHYALEIVDHGGAWHGVLNDYDNNYQATLDAGGVRLPIMTPDALSEALTASLGGQKLDLIVFDACLMASQTIAAALSPHAHYMVASELSTFNYPATPDGWNHRMHVPYSTAESRVLLPEEFGIIIADSYMDCVGANLMQTMSVTSLDAYPAFSQAMAEVAAVLTNAVSTAISDERVTTAVQVVNSLAEDYGTWTQHENDVGSSPYYGADIGAFLSRWAAVLDDRVSEEAASAAAAARRALELYSTMIVHERHTRHHRNAYTGMVIFFPGHLARENDDKAAAARYQAMQISTGDPLDEGWRQFIVALSGALVAPIEAFTDSGTIDQTGGYTNGMDLEWHLTCSDPSASPTLRFSSFHTENTYDHVDVHDGSSSDSHRLISASGASIPDTIHGSGPSLYVSFHTDGSVVDDGFRAEFSCPAATTSGPCGGSTTELSQGSTIDMSGGYTNNMDCSWRLTCSSTPSLSFSEFETESSIDLVTVYDGASSGATELAHLSGNSLPVAIEGTGTTLFIEFYTDSSVTYDGFTAHASCTESTSGSGGSNACDGVRMVLTDTGTIDHSGGYSNSEECTWMLTCSDPGSIATLSFSSFGTENNFDWVTVSDGDDVIARMSGSSRLDEPIRGSGTDLVVQFTTDSSYTNEGFVASFDCEPASTSTGDNAGCSKQHNCNTCVYATYACGLLWSNECFCEWSESGCDEAWLGFGSHTANVDHCIAYGYGEGSIEDIDQASTKELEFSLTNGVASNDEDSGIVHISAECPSTTIDVTLLTGVMDDDVSSSIHELGVDSLWLLDAKGGTTETDTSVVDIWWTSAQVAPFAFDATTNTTEVHGEWDGLSEVLSQPQPGPSPDRSAFVFSSTRHVEKDHTSDDKDVMVTSFLVSYYSAGVDVPGDGSGGVLATLQTSYTQADDGTFDLLSKVLSTQMDTHSAIEQVVPIDAGGSIVAILRGSKADDNGLPVGHPHHYLYKPFDSALEWGPTLRISRQAVTEDLGDGQLVSAKEVVMLEAEAITGETDFFAAVFESGDLITDHAGNQSLTATDGSHLIFLLVCFGVIFVCVLAVLAKLCYKVQLPSCSCCRKCSGETISYSGVGDFNRNASKMRSLSDSNYLELQGEGQAQQPTDDTAMHDVPLDDKEQQPMLSGQASNAPLQGAV